MSHALLKFYCDCDFVCDSLEVGRALFQNLTQFSFHYTVICIKLEYMFTRGLFVLFQDKI